MTLLSLQVLNNRRGQPVALPRKALADYVRERGLVAHVSLSDEIDSAVAFVIIEQREGAAQSGPEVERDTGTPAADVGSTDRTEP